MAKVSARLNSWAIEELRGNGQVNQDVLLTWYKKGLLQFQKMILEYLSWLQSTSHVFANVVKWQDEYPLPLWEAGKPDFYSIIQLRIAYHNDKNDNPIYRICKPINFSDYNINPLKNIPETGDVKVQWWQQVGWPHVWEQISESFPRYVFVDKDTIKIFPTPTEDITRGLTLTYNFIDDIESIDEDTYEESLNLPRYFFDAIEDYMTFRLYQAENPDMAQWYYQQFEKTLTDNIYWLNKDKRPVEEWFANLRPFYIN